MTTPSDNANVLYPKTEALIKNILDNPSKKSRKDILRNKKYVEKNNDYKEFKKVATNIATQYNEARHMVNETKLLLTEAPDEAVQSLTESLEKDLDKIKDKVEYISTAFNGVKRDGTVNVQQRLNVLKLSEDAQQLEENLIHTILPTAAELGVKLIAHIEKIEEDLKDE